MEKAYDVKVLVEKLKGRGLDLAEGGAVIALEEVMEWVSESAIVSTTPYDDLLSSIFPFIKVELLKQIDKIDGRLIKLKVKSDN